MFCVECGTRILSNSNFCQSCGFNQPKDMVEKPPAVEQAADLSPQTALAGSGAEVKASWTPMSISNSIVKGVLDLFRTVFGIKYFEMNERGLERLAGFMAPVSALAGLALAIFFALKADALPDRVRVSIALLGGAWVIAVAVAFYIGSKFLSCCSVVIKNNPSSISSAEYLDALGLVTIIAVIGAIIGGATFMVYAESAELLKWLLPAMVLAIYFISIMLNPKLISTEVHPGSTAGEDALSIMVISYKAAVRLAGITFGSLTAVGSAMMAYSAYDLIKSDGAAMNEFWSAGLSGMVGLWLTLGGLLYPFMIYVAFIVAYLIIDLCKAVIVAGKVTARAN